MSIRINQTILIKVNKFEYDFLLFVRNKMPYGKCVLFTKDGMPVRIEKALDSILFGIENKEGLGISHEKKNG